MSLICNWKDRKTGAIITDACLLARINRNENSDYFDINIYIYNSHQDRIKNLHPMFKNLSIRVFATDANYNNFFSKDKILDENSSETIQSYEYLKSLTDFECNDLTKSTDAFTQSEIDERKIDGLSSCTDGYKVYNKTTCTFQIFNSNLNKFEDE